MNLREMLERQQELVNNARKEGRTLTAEEQREFDQLQGKIDAARSEENQDGGYAGTGEETDNDERGLEAERTRAAEITELCRSFSDMELNASDLIREGHSVDHVREMIINKQIESGRPANARVLSDENENFRNHVSDAMLLRAGIDLGPNTERRVEAANQYRDLSLERLAVRCLEQDGVKTGSMSRDQLFSALMERQYFNPTAAFPSIMDQVIRKAYEAGYNQVNATYQEWVTIGTLSDFKKTKGDYVAGAAGDFLEVPENGELKAGLPQDYQRPERQLKTYGRQFTMSRQAFINDDIGFITTIPARYAAAARRTINKQVYSVLYKNGTIYDGKALFSADHKNMITTGAKPTKDTLKAMTLLLQKQLGFDGEAINIRPAYILTPSDYEMDFRELLLSPTISDENITGKYNPFYGSSMKVVVDDTISGLAGTAAVPWHVVGNKMDAKSIQVDFLNGQQIPTIQRATVPGTLGFVWDIYLDWAISVQDYRGIARNPGVTL